VLNVDLILPNAVRLPGLANLPLHLLPRLSDIELLLHAVFQFLIDRDIVQRVVVDSVAQRLLVLVVVLLLDLHDYPRELNSFLFLLALARQLDLPHALLDLVVLDSVIRELQPANDLLDQALSVAVVEPNHLVPVAEIRFRVLHMLLLEHISDWKR
jgi:hypothetical protein